VGQTQLQSPNQPEAALEGLESTPTAENILSNSNTSDAQDTEMEGEGELLAPAGTTETTEEAGHSTNSTQEEDGRSIWDHPGVEVLEPELRRLCDIKPKAPQLQYRTEVFSGRTRSATREIQL